MGRSQMLRIEAFRWTEAMYCWSNWIEDKD